jgi:hypothetical protein
MRGSKLMFDLHAVVPLFKSLHRQLGMSTTGQSFELVFKLLGLLCHHLVKLHV